VRDLVSIEYNALIAFFNYKLLSIDLVDPHKKFKEQFGIYFMKGLCHKCQSSNVEITVQDGIPVCTVCTEKTD